MSTLGKYLYNLLYLLSNILFPVVTFAWAARVLGPEGIGRVQIVLNLAQYFVMVAALGLSVYGVREVARVAGDRERLGRVFFALVTINLVTSLLMLGVYFVVVTATGWLAKDPGLYGVAGLLILTGFLTLDWFYTGVSRFGFLSLRSVVVKSLALAALFLFVRDRNDLLIYLAINVMTVVLTNLWNALEVSRMVRFSFRGVALRSHFSGLGILFLITLMVSIYTVADTLLVGYLAGERAAGLYTAAIRINKILIPFIVALGTVLIPEITRSIDRNHEGRLRKLAGRSFAYLCLVGIPVSMLLFAFAPEIMRIFSGAGFDDAVPAMRISALLPAMIGLGHLFGLQLLVSGGHEKKYLVAVTAGMVVSLILNFWLIPRMQEAGAAVAVTATEAVVTTICILFVFRIFKLSLSWSLAVTTLLVSLVFIPIAWLLRDWMTAPVWILVIGVLASGAWFAGMQRLVIREPHLQELILLLKEKIDIRRRGA